MKEIVNLLPQCLLDVVIFVWIFQFSEIRDQFDFIMSITIKFVDISGMINTFVISNVPVHLHLNFLLEMCFFP